MQPSRTLHAGLSMLASALLAITLAACNSSTAPSLLASGKEYVAKKDHKAAALQFKSALQLDPQSAEARFLLGEALLNSGDPTSAVIELSKVLDQKYPAEKVMPTLAKALVLTGEYRKLATLYGELVLEDKLAQASLKSSVATAWGALGDRAKTEAAVAAALAAQPDFGPALILNARVLAGRRDLDGALALVEKTLARDDSFYEAWLLKGEIVALRGNDTKTVEAAEAAFRKSLAIEKAYVSAHLALISSRLRQKDLAGAKAQLEQLRALLPTHPTTQFLDAQLALTEQNYPKAREVTQQLLKIAPNHGGVQQLAGVVEALSGSLVVAETHFTKALQIAPSLEFSRRSLAQVQLRMGRPVVALETLRPLIGESSTNARAIALAGESALRLGDAGTAEALFKRAVRLEPDDLRLKTVLALSNLNRGDVGPAFEELERLAANSSETFADQALISARFKRREFDAALAAADALAKKQPRDASVQHLRGRILLATRKFPEARAALEQALKLDPAFFAATADLAAIDLIEKKPGQAQARFEAAIKTDPRNHYALMALADVKQNSGASTEEIKGLLSEAAKAAQNDPAPRLKLIDLYLKKRQFKDALVVAQEAVVAFPNDIAVLDAVGRAQLEAGDIEQSISTFRKLAATDPSSSLAYSRLADVYLASGKRDQAETALRKALEIEPNVAAVQIALVDLLVAKNRKADALAIARQMQQQRPKDRAGYMLEGALHNRLKDPNAAVAAFRNGVAKTEDGTLAGMLHRYLLQQGREAEASQFGVAWTKAHPKDVAFEYHLALANMRKGELEAAQGHLERVVAQFPDNGLARNNLAWVLVSRGQPGGLVHAQKAAELAPTSAAVQDTLAMALAFERRYDEALATQRKAIELAPQDHGLKLGLARIALQAGDKALARTELERLQALGATFPNQAEVTKLFKTL